jgi:hypothetical protein
MFRYLALPALLATLFASGSARAEEPGDTVSYAFDDDKVLGDTVNPLGEIMTVRKRPARESLVRARQSFVPELLKSVEAL